ncbi:MAG: hypothetical protein HQ522_23020 [Bacteroidetes bacterium]|nr:hypothetical protein [Bacteroidota bacterium]
MKNLALFAVLALILFSCGNQKSKKQIVEQTKPEVLVLSVDELYENAGDLTDKEVVVKGTVMHVCKEGGQRCFIMGSNEDINVRIEAGEKIGAFNQELMGSDVEIVGILIQVKTEAEAHNPGQHENGELAEGEHKEDTETDNAHKVIAESQDASEIVYFIEGLKFKEL